MQSGTVDGLYYEVHGGPAAGRETVVLSAGLGGSGAFWTPQMAALLSRFQVVLYDHRGTGRGVRTLTQPHTVAAMGDDIVKVMDALGLDRAHVVGHAAGGNAGLAMALDHPGRMAKLVVVNGWSRPDPHIQRCFDTRLALLNNTGIAAYVHAQPLFLYPADWISANNARLEAEEIHHIHGFPDPDVMRARIQALLAFDIDADLPRIACPVLVSASADDMLVPLSCSRRLAERLPDATLDIAPWGGHGFTVTAAEGFNATVVSFLVGA
ncbi:pyrimidine utilization protein D [Caulobacter sp. Root655]|uniref:pyrimidine utilization protein D n=1 Tax=Caulobacter sp. Root655 TaxID=1736578 RepID=UPI0006F1CBEA|nr:pyrimidine utilization protein D [Caulobacter sp. Root655]KRA62312.1 pyrimidine utilization protein D [Caulobacter sp. Root655]